MVDIPSDEDLQRLRLTPSGKGGEDSFIERKPANDKTGWLKSVVAFANSTPIDFPAVLFIGVQEDGHVFSTMKDTNLDTLQKTLADYIKDVYPPLYWFPKGLKDENGLPFLAIIVPGSADRPHFTGHAYVRNGSRSEKASEEQFAVLIAQRQSIAYELTKHIGQSVSLLPSHVSPNQPPARIVITACTQFYFTFEDYSARPRPFSVPFSSVEISYDHENKRPLLFIAQRFTWHLGNIFQ